MASDILAEVRTKSFGLYCTCSGGTAAAGDATTTIVPSGTRVKIQAIVCGGAATTDITTVHDASGIPLFKGAAAINTLNGVTFPCGLEADGLQVGFAGATTGYCNIFYAK